MATLTRYATSNAIGVTGWTNPGNAYVAYDSNYATAAPAKNATISSYYGGFNLADTIGANDTINSVDFYYGFKVSTKNSIASLAGQAYDGTTAIGSKNTNTSEPTSDTVAYFTAPATLAQLRSADFKILLEAIRGNSTTAVTFSLDYVYVVVDYTPASSNITGSLSQTLESVSLSASGKVEIKAASFATLDDVSVIASGHVQADSVTATLSQTLESAAVSAGGKVGVKSELTAYLDSCSVVSSGKVAVKGTASNALDSCGVSATGKVSVKGAVNQTLENVGLIATSGASFQPITASANIITENVGVIASGKVAIKGSAVIALESAGVNATGKVKVAGRLSAALSDVIAEISATARSPRAPTKLMIIQQHENEIQIVRKPSIRIKAQEKISTVGRGD